MSILPPADLSPHGGSSPHGDSSPHGASRGRLGTHRPHSKHDVATAAGDLPPGPPGTVRGDVPPARPVPAPAPPPESGGRPEQPPRESLANGARRTLEGTDYIHFHGYWVRWYEPMEESLAARKRLIDHLTRGVSLDEFLGDFPTVKRDQAVAFLALSEEALVGADA